MLKARVGVDENCRRRCGELGVDGDIDNALRVVQRPVGCQRDCLWTVIRVGFLTADSGVRRGQVRSFGHQRRHLARIQLFKGGWGLNEARNDANLDELFPLTTLKASVRSS